MTVDSVATVSEPTGQPISWASSVSLQLNWIDSEVALVVRFSWWPPGLRTRWVLRRLLRFLSCNTREQQRAGFSSGFDWEAPVFQREGPIEESSSLNFSDTAVLLLLISLSSLLMVFMMFSEERLSLEQRQYHSATNPADQLLLVTTLLFGCLVRFRW